MPSSYMPLRSAFVAAAKAGIDRINFKDLLLRELRTGAAKAICASYVKAQFLFSGTGETYAAVIDQLILPIERKREAKTSTPQSSGGPHNIWIDGDYYTFIQAATGVVAYTDRYPQRAPGGELNQEFLDVALINEARSEIYCVDVVNEMRRTYEKVELLRSDVKNMIGANQGKAKAKRGTKQKYFHNETVFLKSKSLLPVNLSRKEWEDRVRSELTTKAERNMGEKTFQALYGFLWTDHNEEKRKRGN